MKVPEIKLATCLNLCVKLCILPLLVWWSLVTAALALAQAVTPAGTVIKNQASASYKDSNGIVRVATSNVVETIIQQVAAMQLNQDQNRPVAPGQQVFLPHSVTNTGNGADRFLLTVTNNAGDDFNLNDLTIYEDSDQNGQPDVYSPVTQTATLASQDSWHFVIAATVPATATTGDIANLSVTAVSDFNSAVNESNVDSVSVSDQAVLELTKNIDATSGVSPSVGTHTVTLHYRNTGVGFATDVTIIDALPVGMDYVAGSGRWTETGSTVLTDNNPADAQGTSDTVRYCAYHASCTGLAEAAADPDSDSSNQVTAIISSVAAGAVGQISFEVTIASGLDAGTLLNTAETEYHNGVGLSARYNSNTVSFQILHSADVVLNGSATVSTDGSAEPAIIASSSQGAAVAFENYVWNAGNDTDIFDITIDTAAASFPAGTVYRVLQSDGLTPLIDTSGNGIPDTGPLPAGAVYKAIIQVIPPAAAVGNNGGAGYQVSALATSVADASVTNAMLDRLLNIIATQVDITNVAEFGNAAALGSGAGPETNAVSTVPIDAGTSAVLPLYINNTGASPASFDLAVSSVSDFSSIDLPTDWIVTFKLDGEEDEVTNTGVINPAGFVLINVTISVPGGEAPGDVSLYFRALSELTGASDIKHDSVSVGVVEDILIEPDQSGQTDPGGSYIYSHLLSNNGNSTISPVVLSVIDSKQVDGWSSIIYKDTDNDGIFSSADQQINSLSTLAPGDMIRLFVKVFAPAGAALQDVNTSTLTVAWNAGADTTQVTDATTISESEISIVKEQAPDYGCDGTPDASYGVGGFSVEPGNNCVSYRLTATNAGVLTVFNVVVADATPAFTEYFGSASCSNAGCSIQEPAIGTQGSVVASLASLAAGGAVILEFSVRVE